MTKISVVINTINEEAQLPGCLASVAGFADEVVVVDMHSDDATVEIAKKAGASVYEHKRTGYVEPARNFALSKATGEWILLLDADERLPSTLKSKLKKITANPSADYFTIPRKNIVFGKWLTHSRWWPDYNVRFFKAGKVAWSDEIHSVPKTLGKGADLPATEKNAIEHYNYTSIGQFIDRLNRYSGVQAKELVSEGYKFSWTDLVSKPAGEFFSRYFYGKGYLDGLHGLAVALLQAMSELVVYLKVWELAGFTKKDISLPKLFSQITKISKDYYYWKADALLATTGGAIHRLKKRFRLP